MTGIFGTIFRSLYASEPPASPAYTKKPASDYCRTLKIPPLPVDLVDTILGHHAGDHKTLAACSLVCRSWVPFCRKYMFSIMVLNRVNANALLSILGSPLCTIAAVDKLHMDTTGESSLLVNVLVPLLCTRLSVRRGLHVQAFEFGQSVDLLSVIARSPSFSIIQQLSIQNISASADRLRDAFLFASAFKMLESLVIVGFFVGNTGIDNKDTSLLPRLRTLCVSNKKSDGPTQAIGWLLARPIHVPLTTLRLHGVHKACISQLQVLLSSLSDSLQVFELQLKSMSKVAITLRKNVRLEHLILFGQQSGQVSPIAWIRDILATLDPFTQLTTITINIRNYDLFYADESSWLDLDVLLTQSSLQVDTVRINSDHSYTKVLAQRLAGWSRKGRLVLSRDEGSEEKDSSEEYQIDPSWVMVKRPSWTEI